MPIVNPRLSPSHAAVVNHASWVTPIVVTMATISFWLGVFLFVTGSIISFFPGAECDWFSVAGVLTTLGVLIPKWRFRIAALILGLLCFFYAYTGYVRGVEYDRWLKEHGTAYQLPINLATRLSFGGKVNTTPPAITYLGHYPRFPQEFST